MSVVQEVLDGAEPYIYSCAVDLDPSLVLSDR